MSTKNTKTSSTASSPATDPQKTQFLDFDSSRIKGFDEVHSQIAEIIKSDLYDLIVKHAATISKLHGYDLKGAPITGKRSRFQQAVLGLMKGPFAPIIDSHSGKRVSNEALELQKSREEIEQLKALLAEIKAQK